MSAVYIQRFLRCLMLLGLPLILLIVSCTLGPYDMRAADILDILQGRFSGSYNSSQMMYNVFWTIRFPRVITAALAGAGLAAGGAVFQSMFKNPLASPYTLGVSNGAGFGAALAIIMSLEMLGTQLLAVLFGLGSIGLTFLLSSRSRKGTTSLILAGMLVSAMFASLIALMKYTADPFDKLPQIVLWLMGSLSGSSFAQLSAVLPFYLLMLLVLFLYRWRINVISMGDLEARSYGVNVAQERTLIVLAASVLTALVVSISGIISWVGIVVPQLARMLVGPDFRKIYPACISLGSCYLLVIDDICRTITTAELPLGVVTGLIGMPLFMYFILKMKVEW